ncbi:hypothetical protein [Variovorax saccharolyticus]|uniref:hypothetical protein n=1 Tax=Variovorax saccharolyticus TaxID=3053516 RepID=UPI002576BD2D|nr:hypothetical protein [Variovorax sp. J31P216]MDM0024125.1 hypothetical protein [Variovorax sp. J31P216]
MAKQHTFKEVADLLTLTPDEFDRMIPDLIAWYELAKGLEALLGAEAQNFTWVDDGKPGEVFAVDLHIASTNETHILKGSAFTEPLPDGGPR